MSSSTEDVIQLTYDTWKGDRFRSAQILALHFAELFKTDQQAEAARCLDLLDPKQFGSMLITGVLATTIPYREAMGGAWERFLERSERALVEHWQCSPEDLNAFKRRIRLFK